MERRGFIAASAGAFVSSVARPAFAADAPSVFDDLVSANRILAQQGVVDAFGHVSVRDPDRADRYWLSRSLAPALVTRADFMQYDLQSAPVDAAGRTSYLERFIHGAIYRARPDIRSVVHAHSDAVIPFGVSRVPLRAIYHMGAFLGMSGVPVFEIRASGGDATDLLVSSNALGDALARTLGTANVALMRGHGMVAVGTTIPEAVFRAYYTMQNARLEADAIRLGDVTFLTPGEARHASQTQTGLIARSWDVWKRALRP